MKSIFNIISNRSQSGTCRMDHSNKSKQLDPEAIFTKLTAARKRAASIREVVDKHQKILKEFNLEYCEFDNIASINGKKTNHQELIYCEENPVSLDSLNKVYKGKMKIWYHMSVSDHICLSETIPYEVIDVAVKIIEHSDAAENENNEPEMLYYLQNEPEVIRLFGYHIDPVKRRCLIVLEWCNGNDLYAYINNNYSNVMASKKSMRTVPISLVNIKYIIRWLITTISKCHKYDICYSDLKLDNILFAIANDIKSLRLIDFGASKFIHDHGYDIIYNFISTSAHYTPPEVINKFHKPLNCKFLENYELHGKNLLKIDIWQIGIISYILLNGHFPFNSTKENRHDRHYHIFQQIEMCKPLTFTKNKDINGVALCNSACHDLINKLLAYDPNDRISLDEALRHPWLTDAGEHT